LVLDTVLELGRRVSVLQRELEQLLEGRVGTSYRIRLSAVWRTPAFYPEVS